VKQFLPSDYFLALYSFLFSLYLFCIYDFGFSHQRMFELLMVMEGLKEDCLISS
jgi:hypothetical protein